MASASEPVTFREFCPLYSLLNAIPTKIQKGFRSLVVYLTALDANRDYIAVGSSISMLYLYCRHLGRMRKYNFEVSPALRTQGPRWPVSRSHRACVSPKHPDHCLSPRREVANAACSSFRSETFLKALPLARPPCGASWEAHAAGLAGWVSGCCRRHTC